MVLFLHFRTLFDPALNAPARSKRRDTRASTAQFLGGPSGRRTMSGNHKTKQHKTFEYSRVYHHWGPLGIRHLLEACSRLYRKRPSEANTIIVVQFHCIVVQFHCILSRTTLDRFSTSSRSPLLLLLCYVNKFRDTKPKLFCFYYFPIAFTEISSNFETTIASFLFCGAYLFIEAGCELRTWRRLGYGPHAKNAWRNWYHYAATRRINLADHNATGGPRFRKPPAKRPTPPRRRLRRRPTFFRDAEPFRLHVHGSLFT